MRHSRLRIPATVIALAISVSVMLAIPKDRPEGMSAFLTILIFPACAPALGGLRGPAWPFCSAAIFAALAGLQQMLAADGQTVLVDQISTAALVALACGAMTQLAVILRRNTPRNLERN